MHEVSIAEGILSVVEDAAERNNCSKVKKVVVAVGELAGVDVDALFFAWQSVRRDSICSEAELVVQRPAGQAWCMNCAKNVPISKFGDACPDCGGYQLMPTQGTELKVLEIIEQTN